VRNIDIRVGFHFAVAITSNAQNKLHHYVRTQNDDLRDGGELGAVAADSTPLSLYSLSRTKSQPERRRNGCDALRHPDFLDFGRNKSSIATVLRSAFIT